uniref:Putative ixodes 8-cys protein n=1 Tax=Ixodes ricinus TaxID=34613 RepID=A0A0K8R4N5_IXORI
MSRLIFFFLTFILVYLCVDVVNGAVGEDDLPSFVGNSGAKRSLLEKLKTSCKHHHKTRVIGELKLGKCEMTCATGVAGFFKGPSTLKLQNREPCDNTGGKCYPPGVCAHES